MFLDDVVDGDDIRVMEPGRHLRFPDRAAPRVLSFRVTQVGWPDNLLNRHVAVQQFVMSTPYGPHPAVTDGLVEPIAPGEKAYLLSRIHLARLPRDRSG